MAASTNPAPSQAYCRGATAALTIQGFNVPTSSPSGAGFALNHLVIRSQNLVHDGRGWHGLLINRADGHDAERTEAEKEPVGLAQRFGFDDPFVGGEVE